MSTASPSSRPPTALPATRVSAYENVASMLISLLMLVGVAVVFLFVIWLTSRLFLRQKPVPVELVEYAGRGDHAPGIARDMEEPSADELEEVIEPQVETTLEAITEVITNTPMKNIDVMQTPNAMSSKGKGGLGDSRGPGPLGEGRSDLVPPWQRWEVRFSTAGVDIYAQQLDFFKIELGAAGGGDMVEYAYQLSKSKPARRQGRPEEEQRLYMTWQKGTSPLARFDKDLLERAGIKTARRLILQFYPKEVERELLTLEATNAKGRDAREFLKTIFGVRPTKSGGYEFFVQEQYFRPAPRM